jgi:hypothetical protein
VTVSAPSRAASAQPRVVVATPHSDCTERMRSKASAAKLVGVASTIRSCAPSGTVTAKTRSGEAPSVEQLAP